MTKTALKKEELIKVIKGSWDKNYDLFDNDHMITIEEALDSLEETVREETLEEVTTLAQVYRADKIKTVDEAILWNEFVRTLDQLKAGGKK